MSLLCHMENKMLSEASVSHYMFRRFSAVHLVNQHRPISLIKPDCSTPLGTCKTEIQRRMISLRQLWYQVWTVRS